MFGIGTGELLLILVIAVLVVGPERMVEFAGQLGKWLAQFRQTTEGVTKDFREAFSLEAGEEAEGEASASAQSGETAALQEASSPGLAEAPQGSTSRTEAVGPSSAEAAPVSILLDGEIEPEEGALSGEAGRDAEPVVVEVAELVPEDQDVEPVALDQAVLVDEGATEDTPSSEG